MTQELYIIQLHYHVPVAVLDTYLIAHRAYLDESYAKGIFITSGPQNPRTGGIIIAKAKDKNGNKVTREDLANIMDKDPFMLNKAATYNIIEFSTVKASPEFKKLLGEE